MMVWVMEVEKMVNMRTLLAELPHVVDLFVNNAASELSQR